MGRPDLPLDIGYLFLDVAGAQLVGEIETHRGDDLIGRELHGEGAVSPGDRTLRAGDAQDRLVEPVVRPLPDQQALALAGEQGGDNGENDADQDRANAVEDRRPKLDRGAGRQRRDHDTDQRRAVLEQHHKGRRVLAPAEGLVIAERVLHLPELPQRHGP